MTGEQYAHCLDCPATFADRAEMNAHLSSTLAGGSSPHRARVDNPTEDEQRQSRASMAVSDALDCAVESLVREVEYGRVTAEDIRDALHHYDLADEWDAWMRENAPTPEPTPEPTGPQPIDGDTPFDLEGLSA